MNSAMTLKNKCEISACRKIEVKNIQGACIENAGKNAKKCQKFVTFWNTNPITKINMKIRVHLGNVLFIIKSNKF